MLLYVAVFTVAVINDFVWARYITNVQRGLAANAATWAMGTLLLGSFNVISYTHDHYALIPAALGCLSGTYAAVKWSNRNGPKHH